MPEVRLGKLLGGFSEELLRKRVKTKTNQYRLPDQSPAQAVMNESGSNH